MGWSGLKIGLGRLVCGALLGVVIASLAIERPTEARAASCPTMEVVAVRGSGEHSGFGPTLRSLVRHVRDADPMAHADSIGYPAINVRPWEPRYNHDYEQSVTTGQRALAGFIGSFTRSRCGRGTRLYLTGYSQGAEVVDRAFQALGRAPKSRVAGVVVFGDPRFNPAQTGSVDAGTFDPAKSGISIYQYRPPTGLFGTLAVYSPAEAAMVRSYCADHDQVCNYSSPAALLGCARRCAHFHYMDLAFGSPRATYTQAAADFLIGRWRAVSVGPVSSWIVIDSVYCDQANTTCSDVFARNPVRVASAPNGYDRKRDCEWVDAGYSSSLAVDKHFCVALHGALLGSADFAPNGEGWGTQAPATIFNGGDPSGLVTKITWKHWGTRVATGWGLGSIFKPRGGYYPQHVRVELRASDPGTCVAGGQRTYRHLEAREPSRPGGPLGAWFSWSGVRTLCRSPFA